MNKYETLTMRLVILIVFFISGCGAIKAQRQSEYILVELFSDQRLTQRDTLSRVHIYSESMNQKDSLVRRDENVFLIPSRGVEKLIIEAGGVAAQFDVPKRVRGKRFLVMHAHLNKSATSERVSLVVRKGDAMYITNQCDANCHTIWLRTPTLLHLQDNTVTTGFAPLDRYIFDENK
jgi:hypothetical protein